jgi:hypothetical protein
MLHHSGRVLCCDKIVPFEFPPVETCIALLLPSSVLSHSTRGAVNVAVPERSVNVVLLGVIALSILDQYSVTEAVAGTTPSSCLHPVTMAPPTASKNMSMLSCFNIRARKTLLGL